MARNYVAVPFDYAEEMAVLTDEEFGRLVRGLLQYGATGQTPNLIGSERFLWPRAKMQEDRYQQSYDEQVKNKSDRGKKGAAARWEQKQPCDSTDGNAKPCLSILEHTQASTGILDCATDGKIETKIETKTKTYLSPNGERRTQRQKNRTTSSPPSIEDIAAAQADMERTRRIMEQIKREEGTG